jgi:cell division protein FtsI/penicillin-binding protein 2
MRFRVYLVACFVLWLVLFFKLSILQVICGGKYRKIAEEQHKTEVEITAERGKILDRNLKPLAVSFECQSCYAHPQLVTDPVIAAEELSKLGLGIKAEIVQKLRSGKGFVWIRRAIRPEVAERIGQLGLRGVYLISDVQRAYPKGIAGNLVGFCGAEMRGLEGIEYEFDGVLRGSPGKMVVQRDATGHTCPLPEYPKREPENGSHIVLTIDADLQSIAEKELARGVERFKARAATCIIIDPATGEILAMANLPNYNPNMRGNGIPEEWRNRAITDIFEPGSTLKIVTLATALEEGVMARTDSVRVDSGKIVVQGIPIRDVEKHNVLSTAEVLVHSSNVGTVMMAQEIGKSRLYQYLRAFGFGNQVGIDLPGEANGILSKPDEWSDIRLANVAIGQGISVTAIQLAYAFGSVANKGILMRPLIVKRITDSHGNIIREFTPTPIRRVISESTALELVEILNQAVELGTGRKVRYPGLTIAGKTGTAQKVDKNGKYSNSKFTASFCGFFPAHHPRILMSVVVDEPHGLYYYGGDVACSIFKEITIKVVNLLDYQYLSYENGDEEKTVANRF